MSGVANVGSTLYTRKFPKKNFFTMEIFVTIPVRQKSRTLHSCP